MSASKDYFFKRQYDEWEDLTEGQLADKIAEECVDEGEEE